MNTVRAFAFAVAVAVSALLARPLAAQPPAHTARPTTDSGSARWSPLLLGTQINIIHQRLIPFSAPYDGPNSLRHGGDAKTSEAYGFYTGVRLAREFEGYLDVEMIRGKGVSGTVGLAGITNGDVIRQGSADLGDGPYVARIFLRYVHGFGSAMDTIARAVDQVPAVASATRLEVTAGKFGVSDVFDLNRYANSTRVQFLNWGLFQNTAWDYAADTRGYSNGVAVALVSKWWTLRAGSFQMPVRANANVFDSDLGRARGDNVELTATVPATNTTLRVLGYVNHARMGNYRSAIARGAAAGTNPDIVADDRPGRSKTGIGLNLEQPLGDGGETGLFLRAGWSDGKNESFAFTEVDRHFSAGLQLSGARWSRARDRLGIAVVDHALFADHRDYLAAGGSGFLLGDGRLAYGEERIAEGYYRVQLGPYVELSPDVQVISNPGYNRERGPATVASLRFNFRY